MCLSIGERKMMLGLVMEWGQEICVEEGGWEINVEGGDV
jgi:hypothetical protein